MGSFVIQIGDHFQSFGYVKKVSEVKEEKIWGKDYLSWLLSFFSFIYLHRIRFPEAHKNKKTYLQVPAV